MIQNIENSVFTWDPISNDKNPIDKISFQCIQEFLFHCVCNGNHRKGEQDEYNISSFANKDASVKKLAGM